MDGSGLCRIVTVGLTYIPFVCRNESYASRMRSEKPIKFACRVADSPAILPPLPDFVPPKKRIIRWLAD